MRIFSAVRGEDILRVVTEDPPFFFRAPNTSNYFYSFVQPPIYGKTSPLCLLTTGPFCRRLLMRSYVLWTTERWPLPSGTVFRCTDIFNRRSHSLEIPVTPIPGHSYYKFDWTEGTIT
ncbi:hypothetical protein GDO81_018890 [Engystomops pustulosus]|uniref:Uncharacterized protein n=1 Tax=Engystomops pustulosus TaxID=76066 RepID=A0AAV6YV91_ENGPU|nr:hypothetical protein GDO81_018890 [Engystomops pustulosus]